MSRNLARSQFQPRRPQRPLLPSPPTLPKARRRPRRSGISSNNSVTERFTIPLGDVVVGAKKTNTSVSLALLPSTSNLPSLLEMVKMYSLHRLSNLRVTYRPNLLNQAGSIAFAHDPTSSAVQASVSAVRGFSLSAGGPVVGTHTLTVPSSALSHVGWDAWASPKLNPGYISYVATLPAAPVADTSVGTLELSGTVQARSRRPA